MIKKWNTSKFGLPEVSSSKILVVLRIPFFLTLIFCGTSIIFKILGLGFEFQGAIVANPLHFFMKSFNVHCSAWLRLKLNTKMGFKHHHHPPGTPSKDFRLSKVLRVESWYVGFSKDEKCTSDPPPPKKKEKEKITPFMREQNLSIKLKV